MIIKIEKTVLTEEEKDILIKYKDLLRTIAINKAISNLDLITWEELNKVAKKLGFGSTCNCPSGKINTLIRLAQKVKEIENERQNIGDIKGVDKTKKVRNNRRKSSKGSINA